MTVDTWRESETLEFKESWSERALEDLAAFANHDGGRLLIGLRDDGTVKGFDPGDGEIRRIADQAVELGLRPTVTRETRDGKPVVAVTVEAASGLIACKGRYLTRVGSTNREMSQEQLARLVVSRWGHTWDSLSAPRGMGEVDDGAVRDFVRRARPRLPQLRDDEPAEAVLEKLGVAREGALTNAGLLLFGRAPQLTYPTAAVRVGRFKAGAIIVGERTAADGLIAQVDGAMEAFRQLLQARYEIPTEGRGVEAVERREIWEYPLEALREMVVNAVIHRDYAALGDVQIRIHDDRLDCWSPGGLPGGMSAEELRQEGHRSKLRNPLLAQVLYYAGLVEKWGSGTTRMIEACRAQGLPEPEFREDGGGVQVLLRKDAYSPDQLRGLGLNERQVRAVLQAKAGDGITNREYREVGGVADRTAIRDLNDLVERGIMQRVGSTGRGTQYVLVNPPNAPETRQEPAIDVAMGAQGMRDA